MKKTNEIVQRIERQYVGEDCIQTMITYEKAITVLNRDGILFHTKNDSDVYINKYLEDERRYQFPYANIPTHKKMYLFKKYTLTNQLLNFEEPYICINDGFLTQYFVVKDNDKALMVTQSRIMNNWTEHKTREELDDMFKQPIDDTKLYALNLNGGMPRESNDAVLSEEKIVKICKEYLEESAKTYKKSQYSSLFAADFFSYNVDKMTINDIPPNLIIGDGIVLIKVSKDDIDVKIVKIVFMEKDNYELSISKVLINKYTYELIKTLTTKVRKSKEPKINTIINPNITKEDIIEAKKMVKTLRKN